MVSETESRLKISKISQRISKNFREIDEFVKNVLEMIKSKKHTSSIMLFELIFKT